MQTMAWYSFLGVLFFVASAVFASPAPAAEVSLEQLSQAINDMARSDSAMKNKFEETTTALLETQKAIQKVLKAPKAPGGVPYQPSDGVASAVASEGMQQLASQIVSAIKEVGGPVSSNNTQLGDILKELKEMNKHFKEHLSALSCPPPFIKLEDECFNIVLEDVSWSEARSKCLSMGADLAVPADINSLKVYVGQRYPRKNMRNFWIGGKSQEKVWKWLSGDLVDESLWHTNEPSGNGECLAMFDGWENPLTDFPCENERRAICERPIHT